MQRDSEQEEPSVRSVSQEKMKRPKGIRRKDHKIYTIDHYQKKIKNLVLVDGISSQNKKSKEIIDQVENNQFCVVFAQSDNICAAFMIVQMAIADLLRRHVRVYRINIPDTIEATQVWEHIQTGREVWRRRIHPSIVKIELSLSPLIARHIGYQVHERETMNYDRPRKRYRERDEGSRPKLERVE